MAAPHPDRIHPATIGPADLACFELALDPMCVLGPEGQLERVNPALCDALGRTPAQLLRRPAEELVHPHDRAQARSMFRSLALGEAVLDVELRWRHADGSDVRLQWRARGTPDGKAYAVGRDVSAVRRDEALLRRACRAVQVGGWAFDLRTRELHLTEEVHRMLGTRGATLTPSFEALLARVHEDDRAAVQAAFVTQGRFEVEARFQTFAGENLLLHVVGAFEFDSRVPVAVSGSLQDVTHARRAEREERELRHLMEAAIEQSPTGIVVADVPEGTVRFANSAALGVRGGDPRRLTSIDLEDYRSAWQTFYPDGSPYPSQELPLARAILDGEVTRDELLIVRRDDGEERWVEASAGPVHDEAGERVAGIVVFSDVTRRRRALEKNRWLRSLLEATTDFVVSFDLAGRVSYLNTALRRLLDLPEGDSSPALSELFRSDVLETLNSEAVPAATANGSWAGEVWLRGHDGRDLPVSVVLVVQRDAGGEAEFFSAIMRDLTSAKEIEHRLVISQRMEGVGRLAGGVAHDFNNLLTVIVGNLELIDDVVQDPDVRASLEEIGQATEQARQLTAQLLAFARRQLIEPVVVDLGTLVEETARMLRRLVGEDIELVVTPGDETLMVRVDPSQLQQVLINLCVNARDAMPNGGRLDVVVDRDPATGFVRLRVRDTGEGVEPDVLQHVFEPFFTTKPIGRGTGLGLSTCHGIVQQAGGSITLESRSEGTTATVLLPQVTASYSVAGDDRSKVAPSADREGTVLLIEDEESVRTIVERWLSKLGYQVYSAASAADVPRLEAELDGRFDAIVSDVVLPGPSGPEIVDDLLSRHPGVAVLFASGYTDELLSQHRIFERGFHFLQKPYSPSQLAARLEQLLGSD